LLAQQRRALILDRVRQDGGARVADLVRELHVSDMTIRRDIELLQSDGLVERVHGGATALAGSALFEPSFATKSVLQQPEKRSIADAAVGYVRPNSAIGISAGTTTYAFARRLADVPGLTVVTNGVRIADALHEIRRPDQTVILTGGVRTPSDGLVGPFAAAALRRVHLDLVFMGVHGMDERAGFTSPNPSEAETNRALIDAGRRLVVLADHTKWGMIGLSSIARLDEADVLISDWQLSDNARQILGDAVKELVVVDDPREAGGREAGASVGVSDNVADISSWSR
jgi:DeoR/GlpR family transcriptional regulator of sugar metabolism